MVAQRWSSDRAELEVAAASLADAVREVATARSEAVAIGADAAARATADLVRAGGRRSTAASAERPSFRQEPELLFLLDQAARGASADAARVAERALDAMARGGIFDQVGGGFHRYSTDAAWQVPHFEKMLYNQAQLARAYLAGYRLTGRLSFRRAAEQTLDYVLREMTSPEGGFYSATDADSDGAEGRFFVWTPADLERALGAGDAAWAAKVFGVTAEGNFEDGRTVLHLPQPLDVVARESAVPLAATLERLDRVRERLRRGARATESAAARRQGADRVERHDDHGAGRGLRGAGRRPLARRRRARRRPVVVVVAARPRPPVASATRRRLVGRGAARGSRLLRRGAARALRRDRRAAIPRRARSRPSTA